jgi:hypothetical protein
MASQTPLILADNVFDRINLYVTALLSSTAPALGRDVQYVADYRRERTYWQAISAAVGNGVNVDFGVGQVGPAVDACWIDRGHNLWGKQVFIDNSNDGFATSPSSTTVNRFSRA